MSYERREVRKIADREEWADKWIRQEGEIEMDHRECMRLGLVSGELAELGRFCEEQAQERAERREDEYCFSGGGPIRVVPWCWGGEGQ